MTGIARFAPWRLSFLLLALLLLLVGRAAAGRAVLPGINPHDHRVVVDPRRAPWHAVVKVQTNIGSKCTGFLAGPRLVVTAAHCLSNRRTRALLEPVSLHVLFGYQRGEYSRHLLVRGYTVGPGFDEAAPARDPGADWAGLVLAGAPPAEVAPLPLATALPRSGAAVALAGYNQDRAQLLLADLACHITGRVRIRGALLLTDDCSATRGTSGGPLLMRTAGGWAVLGIAIAAGRLGNFAVPAAAFAGAAR